MIVVPFDGDPPKVNAGDLVEVRDAFGRWHPAKANSEPRYDRTKAIGRRCYLTISVTVAGWPNSVNWPAGLVRQPERPTANTAQ